MEVFRGGPFGKIFASAVEVPVLLMTVEDVVV